MHAKEKSISVPFMIIFSHAMTFAIGLLTAGHMQGIILTKDNNLFLYFLVTLDILCVTILATRPRIASFPCISGDPTRERRIWKSNHIIWLRINIWMFGGKKSRKVLPPKIETCMGSGGAYGFIISCMNFFICAAIQKVYEKKNLHL